MTASECLAALKAGLVHIGRQQSLTFVQKLWVALLKCIAILGYYSGKARSLRRPLIALERGTSSVSQWNRDASGGETVVAAPPLLAVIIPVYAHTLQDVLLLNGALQQLAQQQGCQPTHIVLVDDASPLALDITYAGSGQLIMLRLGANSGPAVARNTGLAWVTARGAGVVCFMDADCIPGPGWLSAMAAAQASAPGIVCGRTFACRPNTAVGLYHDVCGTLNGRQLADGSLLYGCTCNMSLSTVALKGLVFDASFPNAAFEDVEFCVRARKNNVPLTYCAGAVIQHAFAPGAVGLYNQFFRYGMFERHMCAKHPEYLSWLSVSAEISSFGGLPAVLAAVDGEVRPG
ncbi:hypothetical protein WJX81_003688 [Elliptochloris bilobata]|uniref:Glycosyltransferase 2-like domain-containing protein n=1 Tax=Elliptochloris bilobata TaxID=381761 RepID=A0AAW1RHG3_9CHLO